MNFLNELKNFLIKIFATPNLQPSSDLASIILAYNNSLGLFKVSPIWTNPLEGSTIHKIDSTQATAIAIAVQTSAPKYVLPVSYVLACLAIESTLDPLAENKNLKGSNPANDPMGYDEGIAQLKLKYLTDKQGATVQERLTFAQNVPLAVDYHCGIMCDNLVSAKNTIATVAAPKADSRLKNPYLLATGIYNFGPTGMMSQYLAGTFPSHCAEVQTIEAQIAKAMMVTPATAI